MPKDVFLTRLNHSTVGTMAIAKWFVDRGYDVLVRGIKRRPKHSEWKKYADEGDTLIYKDGLCNKIETKRLTRNFTCKTDWPFKDEFIVCAKHSYDRAKIKAHAYVIINDKMTHMATVKPRSTADKWTISSKTDSGYAEPYSQDFYLCPIDLVEFRRMYEAPDQT